MSTLRHPLPLPPLAPHLVGHAAGRVGTHHGVPHAGEGLAQRRANSVDLHRVSAGHHNRRNRLRAQQRDGLRAGNGVGGAVGVRGRQRASAGAGLPCEPLFILLPGRMQSLPSREGAWDGPHHFGTRLVRRLSRRSITKRTCEICRARGANFMFSGRSSSPGGRVFLRA